MKALKIGDVAPDFETVDHEGNRISLSGITDIKDVLLFFYRGQWCPICNMHLKKIQKNLKKLEEKNIIAMAITPENIEGINKTIRKTKISIPIIFDKNYKIMKEYQVNFVPSMTLRIIYNSMLGADLKNNQSDDSQTLPVPATYLIGKGRVIKYAHFNPNYMNRASIDEVLKAIGS